MKRKSSLKRRLFCFLVLGAMATGLIPLCSSVQAEEKGALQDIPWEEKAREKDTADKKELSPVMDRERAEKKHRSGFFSITPHRQNYILPLTYNHNPNKEAYEFANLDEPKELEVKFQLSFKVALWENIFWAQ